MESKNLRSKKLNILHGNLRDQYNILYPYIEKFNKIKNNGDYTLDLKLNDSQYHFEYNGYVFSNGYTDQKRLGTGFNIIHDVVYGLSNPHQIEIRVDMYNDNGFVEILSTHLGYSPVINFMSHIRREHKKDKNDDIYFNNLTVDFKSNLLLYISKHESESILNEYLSLNRTFYSENLLESVLGLKKFNL